MMLKNYYNGLNSNKILLFTTRQLCYHSAGFFAAQLADALEKAGYICEMCEIPEDGIAGEMREQAVPAKDTAGGDFAAGSSRAGALYRKGIRGGH